ncbi:hypothetical protein ES707_02986 [subsurface metagenome]
MPEKPNKKPNKGEIREWAKSHRRGDELVVEEAKPTNTPGIEALRKVVTKL